GRHRQSVRGHAGHHRLRLVRGSCFFHQSLPLAYHCRGAAGRGGAVRAQGAHRHAGGCVAEAAQMSLLDVRILRKNFGGLVVTDDVSLTLAPGDRVALIGPNGAGKTTFVNLVTGHVPPDSGSVAIAGTDLTSASPTRRVKA